MALSPMMKQYFQIKDKHQDTIVMFRLGDFYEMFFDDALLASKELEITLTGRDCGLSERAPMCGVPYHAVDAYVSRLIQNGHKVAICEQLTNPAESKGIVERDVVRIITPGTVIEPTNLDEKRNNYLLVIYSDSSSITLAYADVSTGQFYVSWVDSTSVTGSILDEVVRIAPTEVICNSTAFDLVSNSIIPKLIVNPVDTYAEENFSLIQAKRTLFDHFQVTDAAQIGLNSDREICAAGALLAYLSYTQKNSLQHIHEIEVYQIQDYMRIDVSTRRNLELTKTTRNNEKRGSLLHVLDKTITAMGGRLLRRWLEQPLQSKKKIDSRLEAVDQISSDLIRKQNISDLLAKISDMERLSTKISYQKVTPRDCIALQQSILVLPQIKGCLDNYTSSELQIVNEMINPMTDVEKLLADAIAENPPVNTASGGIIRDGYSPELDKLRYTFRNARQLIAQMEAEEREKTGIKNLKIGYNKVFGYYIEITNSHKDMVPYHYIRKQTISTGERFITEELTQLAELIATSEEQSIRLENQIYIDICTTLSERLFDIIRTAQSIAQLDALQSLAQVAITNHYVRPEITEDNCLVIEQGRHPVVEVSLDSNQFVANNTQLNMTDQRFLILTGPNMSGKSTYIRQVALITIMAHIGSFVPAHSARIPITDQIFTRIGAADDLFLGQSTFMVEMMEVANILRNATNRSLIILDEIGRGTSTYDGLSIAWAVIEHICDKTRIGAKTLFATHYHELSELEGKISGIKNYCIAVMEQGEDIVFLHRIVRGGADKSFGIHVAKLAGIDESILKRANHILTRLEEADINKAAILRSGDEAKERFGGKEVAKQLDLSAMLPYHTILEEIRQADITTMTPIDAFYILNRLKEKMKS